MLNAHELVVQSAVIGRPVSGNEEVVAFVQLLPGATIEPVELMRYAAAQLTSYKRPCEIVILEALPAASTGKILKHKLWEVAQAAHAEAPHRRSSADGGVTQRVNCVAHVGSSSFC